MKIDSANAIKIQAQTRLSRYAPRPPTKVFCIELLLLGIRNSEELFNCVPGRLSSHVRDQLLSSQSFVMQPQHDPQMGFSDFACSRSVVRDSSADNRLSALVGWLFELHVQAVEEWQDC